ncbi:YkgJ family cysteine cluster protein [Myxococcus stipitatus]|uniref:YkgJ family cysteine cluster protein n=1 Tax=Myxococcus stipitatus TaxID=83455 RepID=UPI0031453F42
MECTRCGACCVAPDIAALDKPLGLRCPHLLEDNLCGRYDDRPSICRDYQPDEVCRLIEAPTLEERVEKYLSLFGLAEEARAVKEQGCPSMKRARLQAPGVPAGAPGGQRRD